jgi:hypothetical protein
MALVEIDTFVDGWAAEMARARLAAEGIEAVLFDAGSASLGLGLLTPVRLMVEEADQRRAERLLGD